jgi:Flp pilus assembly protein CpaB
VGRRSNVMVLLGIAFFVVGGVVVYLVTQDDGDGGSNAAESPDVTVVVATEDIPAGALGAELVEAGAVRTITVPPERAIANHLSSLGELDGATVVQAVGPDQQITRGAIQGRRRTFEIPEGHEAVAVAVGNVQGGAGYVQAGDRINLYGLFASETGELPVPRAQLLLSDVEVLDVNRSTAPLRGSAAAATADDDPTAAGPTRASGGQVEYLLALSPEDAERVIFTTEYEGLYVSLLADDAPAVSGTPGRDGGTVLQ